MNFENENKGETVTQLLTDRIWPKTKKFNDKTQGKTTAVVAYVTKDHLGLGRGDTLICDATDDAITQGSTSAKTLAQLQIAGVNIYRLPKLHAKLVRMPDRLLIGSTNMTANSVVLLEAALLSSDPELLKQADQYIAGLKIRPDLVKITKTEMKRLLLLPVSSIPKILNQSLWITSVDTFSDDEARQIDTKIQESVHVEDGKSPYYVAFDQGFKDYDRIRIDDWLITIDENGRVERPSKVTGLHKLMDKWGDSTRASSKFIVTYDKPSGRTIDWTKLQKLLKDTNAWTKQEPPDFIEVPDIAIESMTNLFKR